MCVCDCAQGSCPQQWLCCVGLGWGSWWWAPGCSEEVEEPPLQTSESEEQELLLMESPSLSSSSLLVLLSLHKQSSLEVSLHTPLLTTLCTGCEYSCTVLVPFPSCFPFLGFLCFVGFCTSNIFYFVLIYLPFFFKNSSTPLSLFYFPTFFNMYYKKTFDKNAVEKYNKNGFYIGELIEVFVLCPSFTVVLITKAYIFHWTLLWVDVAHGISWTGLVTRTRLCWVIGDTKEGVNATF